MPSKTELKFKRFLMAGIKTKKLEVGFQQEKKSIPIFGWEKSKT